LKLSQLFHYNLTKNVFAGMHKESGKNFLAFFLDHPFIYFGSCLATPVPSAGATGQAPVPSK
jgi:hypothetical protein